MEQRPAGFVLGFFSLPGPPPDGDDERQSRRWRRDHRSQDDREDRGSKNEVSRGEQGGRNCLGARENEAVTLLSRGDVAHCDIRDPEALTPSRPPSSPRRASRYTSTVSALSRRERSPWIFLAFPPRSPVALPCATSASFMPAALNRP
jgi:hypothetical protein